VSAITILDVILGLGFIYLVFSLICSTIIEWSSAIFERRVKLLKRGITELLGQSLADALLVHPLVQGVRKPKRAPNYVADATFARALAQMTLDITHAPGGLPTITVRPGLDGRVTTLMATLVQGSNSLPAVQEDIEKWFHGAMERVSGWYKRWTQLWTFIAAVAVVLVCQVDTIRIARELNHNGAVRSAIAERAIAAGRASSIDGVKPDLSELKELQLGIARAGSAPEPWTFDRVLGLLISIFAISLGGPFWFDFLNRFVNLRQTGAKPNAAGSQIVAQ
jgi:hypothetical protein